MIKVLKKKNNKKRKPISESEVCSAYSNRWLKIDRNRKSKFLCRPIFVYGTKLLKN